MVGAQRADDRVRRLLAQDPLGEHHPRLEQFAGEDLQRRPHLNGLRVIMQLAVGRGILHEQQQPVQKGQLVVRVHAAEKLVASAVIQPPQSGFIEREGENPHRVGRHVDQGA